MEARTGSACIPDVGHRVYRKTLLGGAPGSLLPIYRWSPCEQLGLSDTWMGSHVVQEPVKGPSVSSTVTSF